MKKILLFLAASLLLAGPSHALSPGFIGSTEGLQQETAAYSKIATLTNAQQRATNANIRVIKYGTGGYTVASATVNTSNLASYYFLSNPSLDIRAYTGFYLSMTDTGGKVKKVLLGAVGTGETSQEKITGWTNYGVSPYETFTSSGTNITAAVNSAANGFGITNDAGFTTGKLYLLSTNLTQNSGDRPHAFNGSSTGSAGTLDMNPLAAGAFTRYWTAIDAAHQYFWVGNTTAADFSMTASWKQILTPSALGAWFNPSATGCYEDAGFNFNSATYTFLFTRS